MPHAERRHRTSGIHQRSTQPKGWGQFAQKMFCSAAATFEMAPGRERHHREHDDEASTSSGDVHPPLRLNEATFSL